jgi:hypothetical protein
MSNAKCAILVPVAHSIEPHCDLSLRHLEAAGYNVHRLYGYSQVDRVRNRMATDALANGFRRADVDRQRHGLRAEVGG